MITREGVRLKIQALDRKLFGARRGANLKYREFTIISNNCWGGEIYEYYGLQKQSPTVGLFFMSDDYIRFLSDIKSYLESELLFIKPEDSKWKNYWQSKDSRFGNYPIGVLHNFRGEEVEIFFLHYKSEQQAKEKWERRCNRMNWQRLIVKFNDQNGFNQENLDQFLQLPFSNKLFFTVRKLENMDNNCFMIHQHSGNSILASYEPFGKTKYLNITEYINQINVNS